MMDVVYYGFRKADEVSLRLITESLLEGSQESCCLLNDIIDDFEDVCRRSGLSTPTAGRSFKKLGVPLSIIFVSENKPFLLRNHPSLESSFKRFYGNLYPQYDSGANCIGIPDVFMKNASSGLFRSVFVSTLVASLMPGSVYEPSPDARNLLLTLRILVSLGEISEKIFTQCAKALLENMSSSKLIDLIQTDPLTLTSSGSNRISGVETLAACGGDANLASCLYEMPPTSILMMTRPTGTPLHQIARADTSFYLFAYRKPYTKGLSYALRRYGIDNELSDSEAWALLSTQNLSL